MQDFSDAKTVCRGQFLRLLDRDTWEFVDRFGSNGVVDIVAITDEMELVLVEQLRPSVNCSVIELPAGLIGDQAASRTETVLEAAQRELEEETGFRAGRLIHAATGLAAPGHSTENVHMCIATDLVRVTDGGGVDDEDITVHVVPLSDINNWLFGQSGGGVEIGLRVYAGLYFAHQHLVTKTSP